MPGDDALQTIVRLIYESALEPSSWKLFLEKFASAVNGSGAALAVHDVVNSNGSNRYTAKSFSMNNLSTPANRYRNFGLALLDQSFH